MFRVLALAQSTNQSTLTVHIEPFVVKCGVSDWDVLSQMEFLEQAASSCIARVTMTGSGEAWPDQSLSVQVCSLGFPGPGSLNCEGCLEECF